MGAAVAGTRRALEGTVADSFLSAVPGVPVPGTVLAGKYVLGEQLGAGGMGVVFRAEQLALERPVAIKFLHHVLARDPQIAARFQVEALAAARLDHPNSVAVLDYGEAEDGTPFLVMEYVRGRTLRHIACEGPMTTERAITIALQILAALSEAHAAGIVHADVKTENVLLETRHDGERVKLVDFGLARVGRALVDEPRPDDGEIVVAGTPEYMAPEVILGEPPGPGADIYAVGVILYELLTGVTPFGGGASQAIFARHVQDELVPPSVRFPERHIPRALETVLARALEKDPARRYQEAAAFAAALSAIEPTTAPPPRARPRPESHRSAAGNVTLTMRKPTEPPPGPPTRRLARGSGSSGKPDVASLPGVDDGVVAIEVDDVTTRHAGHARVLDADHRRQRAISELEECVDVLTEGRGAELRPIPALAPVLDALIALYEAVGDLRRAAWAKAVASHVRFAVADAR